MAAYGSTQLGHYRFPSTDPTPVVPQVPQVQTTLPTSAYGQTLPVVWGKCRLPAAYIWVPPILTITSSHIEYWDTITTTTAKMTARLRFARPLVPDSSWSMVRLYANGKLIFDATTGYRQSGLGFRFYDGQSDQPRDPSMVAEEGESNVSAHRGYLDVVVVDFDIIGLGAPPVFEGEFIQDVVITHDYDTFTTLSGVVAFNNLVVDWDSGIAYGFDSAPLAIHWYSIYTKAEFFSATNTLLGLYNYFFELRYSKVLDRLVYLASFSGIDNKAVITDPVSGDNIAASASLQPSTPRGCCLVDLTENALYVGFSSDQRIFAFTLTQTTSTLAYESAANWNGYSSIQCVTPGEVRGSEADFWFCADTDLVKVTLTVLGTPKSVTVVATLADDLRYAVYDAGYLVVWTDVGTVKRINASIGAVVFTATVPYQIQSVATSRGSVPDPDLLELSNEFYFTTGGVSYFTDLGTGVTRSISGADSTPAVTLYSGDKDIGITLNAFDVPQLLRITSSTGTTRRLDDLLSDLMVYGGGYDPSEVDTFNIDDLIQGAVFDVTAGARDVARSIAEPYSIAIFERSGQVIFKRAFTDGAFAIDATFSSSGDIADSGGQAIKARRLNPEEFISRYGINYRDPDQIYQERPQFGEIPSLPLPVAPANDALKARIPIIVDADTAKILATQKVNRLAIERHEFTMILRAKYGDIEPEDIVRFTFANRVITARVVDCTLRPDYMIEITATEFLSGVSVSISGATGRPTEPSAVGTPESRYYHLDIPLLSDSDDLGGAGFVQYHALTSAGQPYWDGATLYRKDAAGLYQQVAGQATNGIVGVALEALPDWDTPYVTEFTRTLTLSILTGDASQMTSATYLEMMNGANFFAIGQPGRWEVCQVMTITNNGDNTYTFEGLRRGRGSSEEYTGTHVAGDYVVWLSEGNVQHLDYAIATLNDAFDFKPVGLGGTLASTPAVNRTVTGEAEKIPKPCQIAVVRSGTKLVISWVRRARIGSYWSDDGDYTAPLGETLEQYVLRIKSGPGGTVLRTFTVNDATSQDYLDAQQTTDFGSTVDPGESLTVDIRQVSGTGVICPTREVTIDL